MSYSEASMLAQLKLEGFYAFEDGLKIADCPHPPSSLRRSLWIEGWRQGFFYKVKKYGQGKL